MSSLRRCPVPLSQSVQSEAWGEAGKACFGREWGNYLLAELYDGIAGVAWAANDGTPADSGSRRRVLEWLGVANCPRVVEECQHSFVWRLPEGCDQWKHHLETARDYCGRRVERIATVSIMEHLSMDNLDAGHGALLIRLIAHHWEAYYRNRAEIAAEGSLSRERYYRSWQVKAKWWWKVCEKLSLRMRDGCPEHVALTALWLPDKRTERAVGGLLPVVDLDRLRERQGCCWPMAYQSGQPADASRSTDRRRVDDTPVQAHTCQSSRRTPCVGGTTSRQCNGMVRRLPGNRGGAGKRFREGLRILPAFMPEGGRLAIRGKRAAVSGRRQRPCHGIR
ncbi:MAG: hypothetical protein FVQ80_14190 [Planctomycetes bacterium]|nr:hypothetical protein [Planctomycetota bacterium]